MTTLANLLCLGLLPRLGQEPALKSGFQDWLVSKPFTPKKISLGLGLSLERVNMMDFVRATNYDFERFSLSSFESCSIFLLEKEKYGVISWPLLKVYYSGFFAAHTLMRSRGSGLVRLGRREVDFLNNVGSVYDPTIGRLNPGYHLYSVERLASNSIGEITLNLVPYVGGKGAHETFWTLFCDFLRQEAQWAMKSEQADAQDFFVLSNELIDAICDDSGNGGIWLSKIRNEINYQHGHQVWFPMDKKSKGLRAFDPGSIPTLLTSRLDISKSKDSVSAFLNTSLYLSGVSKTVSEFVAERSTVGAAFGQKWRRLSEKLKS